MWTFEDCWVFTQGDYMLSKVMKPDLSNIPPRSPIRHHILFCVFVHYYSGLQSTIYLLTYLTFKTLECCFEKAEENKLSTFKDTKGGSGDPPGRLFYDANIRKAKAKQDSCLVWNRKSQHVWTRVLVFVLFLLYFLSNINLSCSQF